MTCMNIISFKLAKRYNRVRHTSDVRPPTNGEKADVSVDKYKRSAAVELRGHRSPQ